MQQNRLSEEHLLEDAMIDQVRNVCLNKFQRLFDGKIQTEAAFAELMSPYSQLLFQLIFVKEIKNE